MDNLSKLVEKDLVCSLETVLTEKYNLDISLDVCKLIINFANQWIEFDDYKPGICVETTEITYIPFEFTVMGWMRSADSKQYPQAFSTDQMIVSKDECCIGDNQFRFQLQFNRYVALFLVNSAPMIPPNQRTPKVKSWDGNGWHTDLTTTQPLQVEKWNHIALRQSYNLNQKSMTWSIWVNGVEDVTFTRSDVKNDVYIHNNTATLRIGTRHQGLHHGGTDNWKGENNDLHNSFYGDLKGFVWCDYALPNVYIPLHAKIQPKE